MSNKSTAEYKTIAQIEAETDASEIRGSRSLDYVRELALTQFIREVESQNEDFKLTSAHPQFIVRREMPKENPPLFSMGLWVAFSIGEVSFGLSINENVYCPVRFCKSYRLDHKTVLKEYADYTKVDDIVYAGWMLNTNDEAIPLLKKNLHIAFAEIKNQKVPQYKSDIPIYRREKKQVIYT